MSVCVCVTGSSAFHYNSTVEILILYAIAFYFSFYFGSKFRASTSTQFIRIRKKKMYEPTWYRSFFVPLFFAPLLAYHRDDGSFLFIKCLNLGVLANVRLVLCVCTLH